MSAPTLAPFVLVQQLIFIYDNLLDNIKFPCPQCKLQNNSENMSKKTVNGEDKMQEALMTENANIEMQWWNTLREMLSLNLFLTWYLTGQKN